MKVCEVCGGMGHRSKVLCSACKGTGLVCLGREGETHHAALRAEARARGEREGWVEDEWEGEAGNARPVRVPVTSSPRRQVA